MALLLPIVTGLLCGAAALALSRRGWLGALVGALCALALALRPTPVDPDGAARPGDNTAHADSAYTGSAACRSCHPQAYASWHHSYHRTMTQPATPQTVKADWRGEVQREGRTYRFLREGDRYFVDLPEYGTDGATARARRPVVMVTGSHHMQAFWVPAPRADQPADPRGRALFAGVCGACHGPKGEGAEVSVVVPTPQGPETRAAPQLMWAEASPPEVRAALADALHAEAVAHLEADDVEAIARFTDGLMFSGRLMQAPFVWLITDQRWVHEDDTFLQPAAEPADVEPFAEGWSEGCDACHSVNPQFRWSAEQQVAQADVAELGIACEACHGAGRAHVDRHRDPLTRYRARWQGDAGDDIVDPGDLDHRRASAICGQCHSEIIPKAGRFRPGQRMDDHGHVVQVYPEPRPQWLKDAIDDEPELLTATFWADGTMRVAGRDYNAVVRSGCYTQGEMGCLTCHSLHAYEARDDQLAPGKRGDAACAGCHPTQVGPAHSHHEGVGCMDCHMPYTTYGLLKVIRSHQIDSPDPLAAQRTGRPDACSLCHIDRAAAWTGQAMHTWWGYPAPGAELPDESAVVRWAVAGDAVQRAVAARHLGWAPALATGGANWQAPILAGLLDDPYPAVRFQAWRALRHLPGLHRVEALARYDYTGDAAHRQATAAAVRDAWPGLEGHDPARLIEGGQIDEAALRALQAQRDDAPVAVNE